MFDCEPMAGDMDLAPEPGGWGPPPPWPGGAAPGEGVGRSGDCWGAGGVPAAPRTGPAPAAGLRAPPPCSSSEPPPPLSSDCWCCCCCCCC